MKHTSSEYNDEIFVAGPTGSVIAFAHSVSSMLPKENEEIFLANDEDYDKVKTQTGHSSQHTTAFDQQSRRQRMVLDIIASFVRFLAIIIVIYLIFQWIVSRFEQRSTEKRREERIQRSQTDQSIEMRHSRTVSDASNGGHDNDRLI